MIAPVPHPRVLTAAKVVMSPLLLLQAVRVRASALALPEAQGARRGRVQPREPRLARPLRLLVVGDSSAAGVGVERQRDALVGHLARELADALGCPVHWQLVARTGDTTGEALAHVREHRDRGQLAPADVLVTALGVNDVVRQVPVERSGQQLHALHALATEAAGVRYWLHSGLPPMHQFPLLPRPLRWVLGSQAELLNQHLQAQLGDQPDRALRRLPPGLRVDATAGLMARDGFHPGPQGYAIWGRDLARFVATRWKRHQVTPGAERRISLSA